MHVSPSLESAMVRKTHIEEMLVEMITPKIREIEERFSRGEPLTQEDINTLLLKSQFNHINHLDEKLDEVAASVIALEQKFMGLEQKFQGLEQKFFTFKAEVIAEIEKRFRDWEKRLGELEARMEKRMGELETRIEAAQVKMQETVLTTVKWYIVGAGVVLVVMKALDLFVGG